MRILDLFCGAGGCSVGYARAGFEVVGVDLHPQPNYPYEFIQADALEALQRLLSEQGRLDGDEYATSSHPTDLVGGIGRLEDFDAIHASPPCQAYTALRTLQGDREYVDLIAPTRELLRATGLPYVIENVEGARSKLIDPVLICGSSVGLPLLRRHRLFEANFTIMAPPCWHDQGTKQFPALNGADRKRGGRSSIVGVYGNGGDKRANLWPEAMGIDWMTRQELTQAIPPAYCELIGHQLAQYLAPKTSMEGIV